MLHFNITYIIKRKRGNPFSLILLTYIYLKLKCTFFGRTPMTLFSLSFSSQTITAARSTVDGVPTVTCVIQSASEGVKIVGLSLAQSKMSSLVARAGVEIGQCSNAVLRPLLPPFLSSNKFISTSYSKWYHLFMMKVPGSLAHFSV